MTDVKTLLRDAEPAPAAVDPDTAISRGNVLRRRRTARRAALGTAAAIVFLGGVFAVIRPPSGSRDPVAVVTDAGAAAVDAGSARVRSSVVITAGDERVETRIEGILDFANGRSVLEVSNGDVTVAQLNDGEITYIEVPPQHRSATAGQSWMSYATPDPSSRALELSDPAAILQELRRTTEVRRIGREDVNGVRATKYQATTATSSTGEEVPVEGYHVWVSDDGLPTRLELSLALGRIEVTMRSDITDYGIELPSLELPDASDVFPGTEDLADRWLQPELTGVTVGEPSGCDFLSGIAESMTRQAAAMNEAEIANFEQAIASMEANLDQIDPSAPDAESQRESALAMIARFRAIVDSARTGEPVDPRTIPLLPGEPTSTCP